MARVLQISNGIARGVEFASLGTIYDTQLKIVSTSPGAGELQTNGTDSGTGDPILTTGTDITLPSSGTYTGQELYVYLNGRVLDDVADYNFIGAGPTRTQIEFTFDLYVGDVIRFRKDRSE